MFTDCVMIIRWIEKADSSGWNTATGSFQPRSDLWRLAGPSTRLHPASYVMLLDSPPPPLTAPLTLWAAEAATRTLCVCVCVSSFWQGDCDAAAPRRAENPQASVLPEPHAQQCTGEASETARSGGPASRPDSLCSTGAPYALLKTLFLKGRWHIILKPQWHASILKMSTLPLKNVLRWLSQVHGVTLMPWGILICYYDERRKQLANRSGWLWHVCFCSNLLKGRS